MQRVERFCFDSKVSILNNVKNETDRNAAGRTNVGSGDDFDLIGVAAIFWLLLKESWILST